MSELLLGDCVEVMAGMDAGSVDAVVTDPPYGIGFMGKAWDSSFEVADMPMRRNAQQDAVNAGAARQGGRQRAGLDYQRRMARDSRDFQTWCAAWASECLRVLKPGGHLVSFGGTRTYHRLAAGVEDAGFEIRDQLAWLFGSGFPKSRNLGDGYGTALKPAHEPIVLARKPLIGTVADNVALHGVGGLNIDGCRIGFATDGDRESAQVGGKATGKPMSRLGGRTDERLAFEPSDNTNGRWPANVVLDEEAAAMLDEQSGELSSGALQPYTERHENASSFQLRRDKTYESPANTGGASRFFYCAKTSRAERNAGLDGFPAVKSADDGYGSIQTPILDRATPRENWEPHKSANIHPTVKPVALMRWLARLITPPGGLILDPFLGSGTTGVAAALEGFRFVGIEREPDYMAIAQARIQFWEQHGDEALRIAYAIDERETILATGQTSLLDQESAA